MEDDKSASRDCGEFERETNMELEFDERQLLAEGVHDVTIETVKAHFGQYQHSDRRMTLFEKLSEYFHALKKVKCGQSLIIDGSFVMACVDEPEDIDIVLVLPANWNHSADLRPFQYNLMSKKAVKRDFGFDVFVVDSGSVREAEWIKFFAQVSPKWSGCYGWPDDLRKGMLRILL